jgi:hypothetical protein
MSRTAFIAFSLLASGLAAPALAQSDPDIRFEVRNQDDDFLRLSIHRDDWDDWNGRGNGNWSQRISISDLRGTDLGGISPDSIRKGGPVSFAYIRPAGRFDCKGTAHDGVADGRCTFTANAAFDKFLADRDIDRPTRREQFGLAMSGVDSDVVDAVIKEGLGKPTPDQLIALGIFKVTPDFVRSMAHINGFQVHIRDLVQFKIFKITPESVRGYAALGYRDLTANDLVQFSIFKITPEFIRSMADAGYKDIPTHDLVQMRIFGITPEYAKSVAARTGGKPSAQALVRMRISGITPQNGWRHDWQRDWQRNWRWNDERPSQN